MKQLIFLIVLLPLGVKATPPDSKIRICIESYISGFIDSLENQGVTNYISIVELFHVDTNIEYQDYGLVYWYDPKDENFLSLYIENKCRKFRKRCTLRGRIVEYEYLLLMPELDYPFKYFNEFKDELLNAELVNFKEPSGVEVVPLPFKYKIIKLNTELGQLSMNLEKHKFFSSMLIESEDYLINATSKLFPLYLIFENIKNETLLHGRRIKL